MKEIQLTQGKSTLVDDEDFNWLNQWKWCASHEGNTFYAVRAILVNKKTVQIRMHRLILDCPSNLQVDHKDGDGLNNQRNNLRTCSLNENACNNKRKRGMWGFKGVYIRKEQGTFRAYINIYSKRYNLGTFPTVEQAAMAYDIAAIKYHGEFATLNFPEKIEEYKLRIANP